jgi:hypothetical protein
MIGAVERCVRSFEIPINKNENWSQNVGMLLTLDIIELSAFRHSPNVPNYYQFSSCIKILTEYGSSSRQGFSTDRMFSSSAA